MGKIELDHTGSGSGITLSSDGTDLLLDGTAIGGGGGGGFTSIVENYTNGTAPTVTGNDSVGIGDSTTASGADSYAMGHVATAAGGQAIALGNLTNVTSGSTTGAAALGYKATVGAGASGVAIGTSYVSGNNGFAVSIGNNTSTYGALNQYAFAMGNLNKASGYQSVCVGGYANTANNYRSSIINGTSNTVSTNYGTILGGEGNTINTNSNYSIILCGEYNSASQQYTVASGKRAKTKVKGQMAHSAGHFSETGDAQTSMYVLRSDTDNANAQDMSTDNSAASFNNQVSLDNYAAYAFEGTIVAREDATDGTDCAAWKVEGLIRREGNAGTTTLVASTVTAISNTPSWGLALAANTTVGCLKITVTGAASTNIRWVANIRTSETIYA